MFILVILNQKICKVPKYLWLLTKINDIFFLFIIHLFWWHELHDLLGIQTQNWWLILVGSATGIQLSDALGHQHGLLYCVIKLYATKSIIRIFFTIRKGWSHCGFMEQEYAKTTSKRLYIDLDPPCFVPGRRWCGAFWCSDLVTSPADTCGGSQNAATDASDCATSAQPASITKPHRNLCRKQLFKIAWMKVSAGTLSNSDFKGTVSPVRSTCCDKVASSLQNWGFCVRSSSVMSHKGTEARTADEKQQKSSHSQQRRSR